MGSERQIMTQPSSDQVESLLNTFFDNGNEYSLSEIQQNAEYARWLAKIQSSKWSTAILPRRFDGRLSLYACCHNAQDARRFARMLCAYIGPSYSSFSGQKYRIAADDPIDVALNEFTNGHLYRLLIHPKDEQGALRALYSLRTALEQTPPMAVGIPMSTTELVSRFYTSLHVGNGDQAKSIIEKIASEGRLSPLNRTFLKIRLFQRMQQWDAILAMPGLDGVVKAYRPRKITEAIVQAVFYGLLNEVGFGDSPESTLEKFESKAHSRFRKLFASSRFIEYGETARMFLLARAGAVSAEAGITAELQSEVHHLLQIIGESADDWALYRSIASRVLGDTEDFPPPELPESVEDAESTEPLDIPAASLAASVRSDGEGSSEGGPQNNLLEQARILQNAGRKQEALSVLSCAPVTTNSAKMGVGLAAEIGGNEAFSQASALVEGLRDEDRQDLESDMFFRIAWQVVTGDTEGGTIVPESTPELISLVALLIPKNWNEWCKYLLAREDFSHASAVSSAGSGATQWKPDEYGDDSDLCKDLADCLEELEGGPRQHTIQRCLPDLVEFLENVEGESPGLQKLYRTLLMILLTRDRTSPDDRLMILSVARFELTHGVTKLRYRELIEVFRDLWTGCSSSASSLDWGLEAIDVLVEYDSPDEQIRADFLLDVLPAFHRFYRRVQRHQWIVLEGLCNELGATDAWAALSAQMIDEDTSGSDGSDGSDGFESSLSTMLENQLVAIYTLTESAGRRAKRIIESEFSGVRVETCHKKKTTDRLKNLARTADIFILAAGSAAHSATYGISSHRPSELGFVYPMGKGSSSILTALNNHLESLRTAKAS
jgi:hypothetical protein